MHGSGAAVVAELHDIKCSVAMATIAQVREGITHIGQQLASGVELSAEIMGSVLQQLVVFVDIVTRMESEHHALTTQVTS